MTTATATKPRAAKKQEPQPTKLTRFRQAVEDPPASHTNPHFGSNYTTLKDVLDAIRPALDVSELDLVQTVVRVGDGWALMTRLEDDGSEVVSSMMPLTTSGTPQQLGSALTYARRYSLMTLCGLAPAEDDDGEAASAPPRRPAPQQSQGAPPPPSGRHVTTVIPGGRNKGQAIDQADTADIMYWKQRMEADLEADPNHQWAARNREWLAAASKELQRRTSGTLEAQADVADGVAVGGDQDDMPF